MNKERRNQIRQIIGNIEEIKNRLQNVLDEEQEVFDNMPENLQGSIRGMDSENAIDLMEESIEGLESAVSLLEDI